MTFNLKYDFKAQDNNEWSQRLSLIHILRATKGNVSKAKKEKSLNEVNNLMDEFNLSPTLYKLLKDDNLI